MSAVCLDRKFFFLTYGCHLNSRKARWGNTPLDRPLIRGPVDSNLVGSFLSERCNFVAKFCYCHNMSVVCLSFVVVVCAENVCDKTAEAIDRAAFGVNGKFEVIF